MELPKKLESVIADIRHQTETGKHQWYEVVYHDGEKWCHYAGSDTFNNGESVKRWKYTKDIFSSQLEPPVMQKPAGGWISVDEKLPTEGQDVLVYNSFGHIIVAYYWKGFWSDTIPKPSTYYFTVSKWMPLPEPSES